MPSLGTSGYAYSTSTVRIRRAGNFNTALVPTITLHVCSCMAPKASHLSDPGHKAPYARCH